MAGTGSPAQAELKPRPSRGMSKKEKAGEVPTATLEVDQMPHLAPMMAFAFQGTRDSAVFVSEQSLAFCLGRIVATYNAEDRPPMRFSDIHSSVKQTLSLTISPNRKWLVVAERPHSDHAQIALLKPGTLERHRTLTSGANGDVVSFAFSHDSTLLIAVINDTDWRCLVWRMDNFQLADSWNAGFPVDRISICPTNSKEVVTSGPSQLVVWRCNDGDFAGGSRWKDSVVPGIGSDRTCRYPIADHAWITKNRFAVATVSHGIFVVHKGQVQTKLELDFVPKCVVPHSKGFFVGGGGGKLGNFNAEDESKTGAKKGVEGKEAGGYHPMEVFEAPGAGPGVEICHLSVSPTETVAACVLRGTGEEESAQPTPAQDAVLSFSISSMQISGAKPAHMQGVDEASSLFSPLLPGFHSGPVTAMATCTRRPLMVSCSSVDCSVRVWDYSAFTCELVHRFQGEEPLAVAINPLGTHLLVAFKHRVVVMVLLMDQLFQTRHLPLKSCMCLRFSTGGNLVAAVTNLRDIAIYDTVTWTQKAVLKGHVKKISSLAWADDDLHLASVGEDGAVYTWTMDGFSKVEENVIKGSEYNAVLFTPGREGILLAEQKCGLRLLRTADTVIDPTEDLDASVAIDGSARVPGEVFQASVAGEYGSQMPSKPRDIALTSKMDVLVAVHDEGLVRLIPFPLLEDAVGASSGAKYPFHAGDVNVTHVCLDSGGKMVFTADQGGSIMAFFLLDGDDTPEKAAIRLSEEPDREAGMVLVQLPEQKELLSDVTELRVMYSKAVNETSYKMEMQELEWSSQLKVAEDDAALKEEELRKEISALHLAAEEAQHQAERDMVKAGEDKEAAILALREKMDHKFAVEIRRTNRAEKELEKLKRRYGREARDREMEFAHAIEEASMQMQRLELDTGAALVEVEQESDQQLAEMNGLLASEMEVHETEVQAVLDRKRAELATEKESTQLLRAEVTYLKGHCKKAENEADGMRADMEQARRSLEEIQAQKQLLERERDGLKATLDQREEVIIDKDRAYNELLKRCRDNEVYALVRDQKIAKMAAQEEPMQEKLDSQEELITDMEAKHLEQMEIHRRDERVKANERARMRAMEKEMAKVRRQLMERERSISVFTCQLARIVEDRAPDQWPQAVMQLYTATLEANPAAAGASGGAADAEHVHAEMGEVHRQRASLESFVNTLKTIMKRQEHLKEHAMTKVYEENVDMLESISQLRRKNSELLGKIARQDREILKMRSQGGRSGLPGSPTASSPMHAAGGSFRASLPPAGAGSRPASRLGPGGGAGSRGGTPEPREAFGAFSMMGSASVHRPGTTPEGAKRGEPTFPPASGTNLARASTPSGFRSATPDHVAQPDFLRPNGLAQARTRTAPAGALRAEQSEPALGGSRGGSGGGAGGGAPGKGNPWMSTELDDNYHRIMDRRDEIEKLRVQSILDAQKSEIDRLRSQVVQMAQAAAAGSIPEPGVADGGYGHGHGMGSRASTPDELSNFIGTRSLAGPAGSPLVPENSLRSPGTFKGGYSAVKKRAQHQRRRPSTPLDALDPSTKQMMNSKVRGGTKQRTGGGGAATASGQGRPGYTGKGGGGGGGGGAAAGGGGPRPGLEDSAGGDFTFAVGNGSTEPVDWRAGPGGKGSPLKEEGSAVSLGGQAEVASDMVGSMVHELGADDAQLDLYKSRMNRRNITYQNNQ